MSSVRPEITLETLPHREANPLDLGELFFLFLKIGSVAFGGYLAIIAMIEKELSERRGLLKPQVMLDAMALATTLPGPNAVNATAYLGNYLRGLSGALVSVLGLILPSFFLMVGLALLYQRFGELAVVASIFSGFIPAVVAIVIGVAWRLATRTLTIPIQSVFAVIVATVFLLWGGFLTAIFSLVVCGALGVIVLRDSGNCSVRPTFERGEGKHSIAPVLILSGSLVAVTAVLRFSGCTSPLASLWIGFSQMSLAMFGGGYVSVSMMKEVVVDHHFWLTAKQFADAISLGQITPGPVMISATFVGFTVASLTGALVATIGIFLPPTLLVILCGNLHQRVATSPWVEAAFRGIRPCVVGLIVGAAYILAKSCEPSLMSGLIFVGALIATVRYKLDSFYVVPIAGLCGYLGYVICR